jgi:hypothetical protein
MTLTEAIKEALEVWLEKPTDPRDLLVSDDNTVIRELEEMVDAVVQRVLARERAAQQALDTPTATPAPPVPDISYNDNTVLQKEAPRGAGWRGGMRQRILTLLREHPEGLSAEGIRAYLKPEKPLGDTLQGMRVQEKVQTRGRGKGTRYFVA